MEGVLIKFKLFDKLELRFILEIRVRRALRELKFAYEYTLSLKDLVIGRGI